MVTSSSLIAVRWKSLVAGVPSKIPSRSLREWEPLGIAGRAQNGGHLVGEEGHGKMDLHNALKVNSSEPLPTTVPCSSKVLTPT